VPFLTIEGEGGFQQNCFNADAEFAGVCRVAASDLANKQSLALTLRCLTECNLIVEAYLGAVIKLALGDSIDLTAQSDEGMT
jgi:hypothetical protein